MTKNERQKASRVRWQAQGLCNYGCKRPRDPDHASCAVCRARYTKPRTTEGGRRARVGARFKPSPAQTKMRECLKCPRSFLSWGPANRLCQRCTYNAEVTDAGPGTQRLPSLFTEVWGWTV